MTTERVGHHPLCFGCGQANLFGLLAELERVSDRQIAGRWFVKQDHQGPNRGLVHPGIVACALVEAVLLAAPDGLVIARAELSFDPDARLKVGSFCQITAMLDDGEGVRLEAQASAATAESEPVGSLRAALAQGGSPSST